MERQKHWRQLLDREGMAVSEMTADIRECMKSISEENEDRAANFYFWCFGRWSEFYSFLLFPLGF